jgi:hypothetical protein
MLAPITRRKTPIRSQLLVVGISDKCRISSLFKSVLPFTITRDPIDIECAQFVEVLALNTLVPGFTDALSVDRFPQ